MKDTILSELQSLEAKQQRLVIPKGITAPELAEMVMRGEVKLSLQQMRAMIELLPFHAPKLSAVAHGSLNSQDFASKLDRAIERSGKAPLMIEAKPITNVSSNTADVSSDTKRPVPSNGVKPMIPDRRYGRW